MLQLKSSTERLDWGPAAANKPPGAAGAVLSSQAPGRRASAESSPAVPRSGSAGCANGGQEGDREGAFWLHRATAYRVNPKKQKTKNKKTPLSTLGSYSDLKVKTRGQLQRDETRKTKTSQSMHFLETQSWSVHRITAESLRRPLKWILSNSKYSMIIHRATHPWHRALGPDGPESKPSLQPVYWDRWPWDKQWSLNQF